MPKRVCLFTLWTACALGQTVEGTVIDTTSGNGIAGATVEIVAVPKPVRSTDPQLDEQNRRLAAATGDSVYSATTDAQGRFSVANVRDGAYTARYRSQGYIDETRAPSYDPGPAELSRSFQVTAGGDPVKLEGRMIPIAIAAGRLIDGRGEPVPKARVDLIEAGGLIGSQDTDANGRFHLLLFPGASYTLAVSPPLGLKPPDPETVSGRALAWARTYYPGVALPEAATKIVLRSGGELPEIELKLQAVPAHAVRGVLLNPDGTPAPKVAITVGHDAIEQVLRAESKPDGTFELPVLPDGGWRFFAEVERGGVDLRVVQWLEMAGHDLEGLKLRLEAPFTLRGRVAMETPQGWPAPSPVLVSLTRAGRGPGPFLEPRLLARAHADGSFNIERVYPGPYRFDSHEPPPPGYYLDAVRLGDAGIAAPQVELSAGGPPLTLVYKTNGGTVRGAVEKCALGGVVLVPQDSAIRWPAAIHTVRCDSKDRYEIPSVRPGEYYALAFPADGSSRFWTPQWNDSLLNQASRITVRAGETVSADLRGVGPPH